MSCPGQRHQKRCNGMLYRCANCGYYGCVHSGCTNQAFEYDKCLRCGKIGVKRSAGA